MFLFIIASELLSFLLINIIITIIILIVLLIIDVFLLLFTISIICLNRASDFAVPVNELVRLVKLYSAPWESKSAALKKLHEDYEKYVNVEFIERLKYNFFHN